MAPARLAFGTVKGRIKSAHRLARVDIVLYQRETAEDGSKGWVVSDYQFANGGYGLTLSKKTGAYSFRVKPGTYRLEYNGVYGSGHDWGVVAYGSGKVSAAAFGKSVKVRKGKVTKHINTRAAGDFAGLPAPDPGPSMSPNTPTAGSAETVALGTWPRGTTFTYTWQVNNSQKYLSFKRSVTVPHSAAGKSIGVDIYAHVYGKNGYGVSIGTTVSK
ncbi:MAG TPA: hypothetical protein VHV79_13620 [Mycobacteriales bacterium]|nr:hypothetical protein [Mycobacteriales bacterium]